MITLESTSHTVTLPDPLRGYQHRTPVNFVVGFQTDGGTRYQYDKGVQEHIYRAQFLVTDSAEITNLINLWDEVAGGTETFTYTDYDSNAHTVRFNHSSLTDRIITELDQPTGNTIYRLFLELVE